MELSYIRQALGERKLSAVSAITGLHENTLAKIRDGETTAPHPTTLSRLSEYLGTPPYGKSAIDILSLMGDAAHHAWDKRNTLPAEYSGDCTVGLDRNGINVSCRISNRNQEIETGKRSLFAGHRMISYDAVGTARSNILIDAIDAVFDEVFTLASECDK